MDSMPRPMNDYPANSMRNRRYDQSYTYRHYYENQRQRPSYSQNYPHTSKATYQTRSRTIDNQESLLWKDVYGKVETNSESSSSSHSANPSMDATAMFQTFFQQYQQGQQKQQEQQNQNQKDSNGQTNASQQTFPFSEMPDMETILKMKKLFDRLQNQSQTPDPIVALLQAIKPFLQESKKSILDQMIKMLSFRVLFQDFGNLFSS